MQHTQVIYNVHKVNLYTYCTIAIGYTVKTDVYISSCFYSVADFELFLDTISGATK